MLMFPHQPYARAPTRHHNQRRRCRVAALDGQGSERVLGVRVTLRRSLGSRRCVAVRSVVVACCGSRSSRSTVHVFRIIHII